MRAETVSGLGKLFQTLHSATTGTKVWKAAYEQLEQLRRRTMKRVPHDRHKQRETALYVDPVSGGWNIERPVG